MFDLGIKSISGTGNQADFTCGCFYDNNAGVAGYALFTCPQKHFQAHADRQAFRDHTRTHKRRRKACKFCQGAAAPEGI